MVSTIKPVWWSATKLKGYASCPRRFKLEQFVETPEVADGKERHGIVESGYVARDLPGMAKVAGFRKENVELVMKAYERGLLPDPDLVLSCEGRDLPPEYADKQYDRLIFKVLIEDGDQPWGLRGAADLVFMEPGDDDTLWIADWKSRSQDDGEIQGSCYALAYSIMFPGFKKYVFQQRSLTLSWAPDTYEFLAEDMPKVIAFLRTIGFAMQADTQFLPVENKWCNHCRVSDTCPVWLAMAEAPIVPTLPDVKTFTLPVDFGALVELKERSGLYENIAEGLKDRCTKALLTILANGPQKHNGKVYTKGNGVTKYQVKAGKLPEVLAALEKAKINVEDLFELDVTRARELLDKAAKKSVINTEQEFFKKAHKELFEADTYDKINKKSA